MFTPDKPCNPVSLSQDLSSKEDQGEDVRRDLRFTGLVTIKGKIVPGCQQEGLGKGVKVLIDREVKGLIFG